MCGPAVLTETTELPDDPALIETAVDVVRRLKGFGSYGGEKGALRALARRCPGRERGAYEAALRVLARLYDDAVLAIDRHRVVETAPGRKRRRRTTSREDIDFEACLADLDRIHPGEVMEAKGSILHWVIFWHYLK